MLWWLILFSFESIFLLKYTHKEFTDLPKIDTTDDYIKLIGNAELEEMREMVNSPQSKF